MLGFAHRTSNFVSRVSLTRFTFTFTFHDRHGVLLKHRLFSDSPPDCIQ